MQLPAFKGAQQDMPPVLASTYSLNVVYPSLGWATQSEEALVKRDHKQDLFMIALSDVFIGCKYVGGFLVVGNVCGTPTIVHPTNPPNRFHIRRATR